MRTRTSLATLTLLAVPIAAALGASAAAAHTESDLVAVPAGSDATVTLKPTHGCDGSPTIEVAIKVPVAGATAGEVEGWTAATEALDEDSTVVTYTGGSLPADAHGAFPVHFTAPERVGDLLLFPSVQTCADGQEESWISGDPASDNPAPRLLILAADQAPAATIEDVPADAAGRDQLAEIIDVDSTPTTTTSLPSETAAPDTTTAGGPTTNPTPTTVVPETGAGAEASGADGDDGDDGDDGGSNLPVIVGAVALLAALAGGVVLGVRRRSSAG